MQKLKKIREGRDKEGDEDEFEIALTKNDIQQL